MPFCSKWLVLLSIASATPVQAQIAATQPAAIALATTPRDALRLLNEAMRTGNEAGIRALFFAATPSEQRMIDADAAMASALARLRTEAVKKFGVKRADVVTGDTDAAGADSITRIETADIDLRGDVATVTYHDDKHAQQILLRKVDGVWRIPVSELGTPLSPAALNQRLNDLSLQRAVIQEIASKIAAGDFQTPESARDAWRARILTAAASQPSTQPAK